MGWTHQFDNSVNPQADWPGGLSGESFRKPHTLTVNVTSTLSSTLLNKGRFGLNLNNAYNVQPWNLSDSEVRDKARSFMLAGGTSRSGNGSIYDILVQPAAGNSLAPAPNGNVTFAGGLMDTGAATQLSFSNPLYNFADTISWTNGQHAFKFGGDFRFPRSKGNSLQPIPVANNGNLGGTNTESPFANVSNSSSLGTTATPSATNPVWNSNRFPQTARTSVANLAYIMTNSLGSVNTPYWAENYAQVSAGTAGWQDVTTQPERIRETVYTDWALFAKDDWKITKDLTLNLGVRYEYYTPPYITSGLTSTVLDQGSGLFGVSRSPGTYGSLLNAGNLFFSGYGTNGTGAFTNGLGAGAVSLGCSTTAVGTFASRLPTPNCDPNLLSNIEFIGPNSPNPSKTIIPRDRNNFGPAVGFAWQVPWFGQGRTTVRGGYQLTYQRVSIGEGTLAASLGGFLDQNVSANSPNPTSQSITEVTGQNRAALLTDLPTLVPATPSRAPGQTVPVYGRSASMTAFDPELATPYSQNITLSVTRSLSRQFTLDVRYVGNLTRKSTGNINLNTSTALYNPELFDAFAAARRGGKPGAARRVARRNRHCGHGQHHLDLRQQHRNLSYRQNVWSGRHLQHSCGCRPLSNPNGLSGRPPLCAGPDVQLRWGCPSPRHRLWRRLALYAIGNFSSLANVFAGAAAPTGGLQPLVIPAGGTTPQQRVLRNGCDRIANGLYNPQRRPRTLR